MKNPYLKNLSKIEFVLTSACTGRCKHCSQGDHNLEKALMIDADLAAEAVKKVSSEYEINTVMTFGGEPLLHPEAVYKIMNAAKEMKVKKRQLITNGFFTRKKEDILSTVKMLSDCEINDLLLSVDAFHQEHVPLETVKEFALEAKNQGIPIRLQPAWLVSREDRNLYNEKTKKLLLEFEASEIYPNEGNVIFPEGNALKYLSKYFSKSLPENPYIEDPRDVKCLSFSPNGEVLDGNFYKSDIMEIIKNYSPREDSLD